MLLQKPGATADQPEDDIQWRRFPLKEMAKRKWIPAIPDLAERAEDLIRGLITRAGGWQVARAALFRKNDHLRTNAKTDPYALQAWCWQVLATANDNLPDAAYETGTVTLDFLTQVARLSWSDDGPRVAQQFLAQHGIPLVIVRHLPRTYLDGAALRLGDGRPVIALTLRYDRIDSFWFCLLHELAHVGRHMDRDAGTAFIDDLSLRKPDRNWKTGAKPRPTTGQPKRSSPARSGKPARYARPRPLGRHDPRAPPAGSPRHRRREDPLRAPRLPPALPIRRHRQGPPATRLTWMSNPAADRSLSVGNQIAIQEIFKLVRLTASFPRIIYIITSLRGIYSYS